MLWNHHFKRFFECFRKYITVFYKWLVFIWGLGKIDLGKTGAKFVPLHCHVLTMSGAANKSNSQNITRVLFQEWDVWNVIGIKAGWKFKAKQKNQPQKFDF